MNTVGKVRSVGSVRAGRTAVGAAVLVAGALSGVTIVQGQTVAITGATVYPVSGPKISDATIVIQNGRISAIGANVAVPTGATRVDAAGKWITPGLIHANANAGLGVAGLNGQQEGGVQGEVNPSFNPVEGVDPAAFTIPIARTGGITGALLVPGGPFMPGQIPAVNYAGERIDDMIVRKNTALSLDLSDNSKGAGGGSRAGTMARIRRLFNDALEYSRRKPEFLKGNIQPLSAPANELEALLPMLRGEVPLAVSANRRIDLENALRLQQEYRLRMVIFGGVEAWQMAKEIAAAGVPVIIEPNRDIPSFDGLGARLHGDGHCGGGHTALSVNDVIGEAICAGEAGTWRIGHGKSAVDGERPVGRE